MVTTDNLTEKQFAANNSVIAAFGLTIFKVLVGISTGSLGILAEAAHSGLDLAAAMITAFAVNKSGKPADKEHQYGHAKIENISAFVEVFLLLITCVWIIFSAVTRIFSGKFEIQVTIWSFAVIIISIFVDMSRSRMLSKAAKKYHSQALEADALHFSTDIWSSLAVLLGLVCVKTGELTGWEFLRYADAIAAIVVGLIVIRISFKLGKRAIDALLDTAPAGLDKKIISKIEELPDIVDCHHVRIRTIGHQCFIDLHVLINGDAALRQAHKLTDRIEQVIQEIVPEADVTVHPEPTN